MRRFLAVFCLVCFSPLALAATEPLALNTKIPGMRLPISSAILQQGGRLLAMLQTAFQNHVKVGPKAPLVRTEIECAIAKIAAAFVRDMMLNPGGYPDLSPDDFKGLPDALAHYQQREKDWCGPPPGAKTNRGADLVALWVKRNTEGMPQARAMTSKYAERAEKLDADMTARDIATAVAIALAIAARELVPVPVP